MAALHEHKEFVKHFLSKKENTICDLSDIHQERYPEQRGFSARSIKRFCEEKGIGQRGILLDEQLGVVFIIFTVYYIALSYLVFTIIHLHHNLALMDCIKHWSLLPLYPVFFCEVLYK